MRIGIWGYVGISMPTQAWGMVSQRQGRWWVWAGLPGFAMTEKTRAWPALLREDGGRGLGYVALR